MSLDMLCETMDAYKGEVMTDKETMKIVQRLSDLDGTGLIGPATLQKVLGLLGFEATEAEAKEMIREVDEDGDGMLTPEELSKIMSA